MTVLEVDGQRHLLRGRSAGAAELIRDHQDVINQITVGHLEIHFNGPDLKFDVVIRMGSKKLGGETKKTVRET